MCPMAMPISWHLLLYDMRLRSYIYYQNCIIVKHLLVTSLGKSHSPYFHNTYICIVKLLCTILAILIMTLSLQPGCTAAPAAVRSCCMEAERSCCTDEEQPCTDEEHEQNCARVCNPFQVCSCCAFSVVVPAPLPAPLFVSEPRQQAMWAMLCVAITDKPASGIWQPPRLLLS
jgi:hypothetical protein